MSHNNGTQLTHDISQWEAHCGTWLNNCDNLNQVTWGTLRGNLDYWEHLMRQPGNHRHIASN